MSSSPHPYGSNPHTHPLPHTPSPNPTQSILLSTPPISPPPVPDNSILSLLPIPPQSPPPHTQVHVLRFFGFWGWIQPLKFLNSVFWDFLFSEYRGLDRKPNMKGVRHTQHSKFETVWAEVGLTQRLAEVSQTHRLGAWMQQLTEGHLISSCCQEQNRAD